ncbi:MerR family transcriptional regulator [Antribacter gilvus]|uniref:MerR family transcriptional regulator n=1 Tax=Antribacter gilvus TaxID=2304675 RepID=UPI000F78A93B|nr:MerR family transcriptional regulator [Antribacter gilvus]
MEHLSIGDFARASGLTPKALRLYDELGLLPPHHVDPFTGYRWYTPAQLGRAGLVARLRLVGMPLARIRAVTDLPPHAAAREVEAYWRQEEADLASRRAVVSALVADLRSRETSMTTPTSTLRFRSAVRLGQGARPAQQDAAFAGTTCLAVADGFGPDDGPAHLALAGLAALDLPARPDLPAAARLDEVLDDAVRALAARSPRPDPEGTTLTAVLLDGDQLHTLHVGDSRLWLVRDGATLLTTDHTMVTGLVAEGRLTDEEARLHPHRTLLNRVLDARGADADRLTGRVSPADAS